MAGPFYGGAQPFFSEEKLMRTKCVRKLIAVALLSLWIGALAGSPAQAQTKDPLPSWNEGAAKQSIVDFVKRVTTPGSKDFVPVPERIAVFHNDGTLWCEQPLPVQLYFALDRVKALRSRHPGWKSQEPFPPMLKGDVKTALAGGYHALLELIMATPTPMTTVELDQIVNTDLSTANSP